jgi:RNA polymerase sigma-70 factor, ECF subfamily
MKDAALAAGILNGTVDFEVLYNQYSPRVYRSACVLLGNAEEARDMTSCVMMQVWKKLPRYDPTRSTLWRWIKLLIKTSAYARWRKRRLATVNIEGLAETDLEPSCEGPATAYERAAVWRAIEGLPEPERSVLAFHYHDGYAWPEVARMLDLSMRTLMRVALRGLAHLKELL